MTEFTANVLKFLVTALIAGALAAAMHSARADRPPGGMESAAHHEIEG